VKAEEGYVIWYPRQGYAVDDLSIADWPLWLLEEARAPRKRKDEGKGDGRSNGYPRTFISRREDGSGLVDALRQIDPRDFGKDPDKDHYDEWFALAGACKAIGISREEFVEWCLGDEAYADHGPKIERIWDSAIGAHGGAFYAALSERGIRLTPKDKSPGVHISASGTGNLASRSHGLITWLSRNAHGDGLFSAACLLAEIGLTQDAATKTIDGNLPRLRRALGDAEFTRQIERGFAHMADKLKELE
jgi:hypothetical protein